MPETEASFNPSQENRSNAKELEQRLWAKAEELSEIRRGLAERMKELYAKINGGDVGGIGLQAEQLRANLENEYWRLDAKVNDIKELEAKIEVMLEGLDLGEANSEEIGNFLAEPEHEQEGEKLSRYKQRILEEKQRLGIDPREIRADMYDEFGSEKMHLTTGRNAGHRVKGTFNSTDAEKEFFSRTADTHGGKVEHGKKGDTYISKSGKRIRKV